MKKLLFLIVFGFLTFTVYSQFRIVGPGIKGCSGVAKPGNYYEYVVEPKPVGDVHWYIANGSCKEIPDMDNNTYTGDRVNVKWLDNFTEGKIKISGNLGNVGQTSTEEIVTITSNSDPDPDPKPGEIKINLSKRKVRAGEEFSISITLPYPGAPFHNLYYRGNDLCITSGTGTLNATGYFLKPGSKRLTVELAIPESSTQSRIYTNFVYLTVVPSLINGPGLVGDNTSVWVKELPENFNINWSVSSNMQIVSGQGTSQVTVKKASSPSYISGEGKITATIQGVEIYKNVWVGPPSPDNIKLRAGNNNTLYSSPGIRNEVTAEWQGAPESGILEYEWLCGGWTVSSSFPKKDLVYLVPQTSGPSPTGNIRIRARNECGWGSWGNKTLKVSNTRPNNYSALNVPYYDVLLSSSKLLTVKRNLLEDQKSIDNLQTDFELYNLNTGVLSKKGKFMSSEESIDVSSLSTGTYVLVLIMNGNKEEHKIIIR